MEYPHPQTETGEFSDIKPSENNSEDVGVTEAEVAAANEAYTTAPPSRYDRRLTKPLSAMLNH